MNIIFYISSVLAVFATIMVITRLNAVHALIYLILSLLSVAVIFFTLGAPFVAALEVIIYAGAIMVLFIFVMMMLNLGRESASQEKKLFSPGQWIIPVIIAAVLMAEFLYVFLSKNAVQLQVTMVEPQAVGASLFGQYLLAVELAAMMLLSGIIGAYHLGKRKKKTVHRFLKDQQE
jgi:NADH-quinone oxidoreductase subunit J